MENILTILVTGIIVCGIVVAVYGIWRVWNFIINDVSRNIDSENR